jgi:hypothetical protein
MAARRGGQGTSGRDSRRAGARRLILRRGRRPQNAAVSVYVGRAEPLHHERAMQAQQRGLRPKWNVPMPSSADRERGAREIRRDYREDSYQNRRREVRTRLFDPGRAGIVLAAGAGTVRLFGGSTRGTRRGVSSILTRTFRLGVAVTGRECIVWRGRRLNQGPASMTTRLTAQPRPETAAAKRNRYRQEEANEDPEWAVTVEHESAAVYTPGGRTLCGGFGGPRRGSPPARVGDVAPFVPPRPTVACKPTTSPQNLVDLQRTGSIRLWIRSYRRPRGNAGAFSFRGPACRRRPSGSLGTRRAPQNARSRSIRVRRSVTEWMSRRRGHRVCLEGGRLWSDVNTACCCLRSFEKRPGASAQVPSAMRP